MFLVLVSWVDLSCESGRPSTVAAGWDPGYGRRLADDLAAAGVVEVHAQLFGRSGPGGSLTLLSTTIDRLRERMIALGASADEIDEAQRLLADPEDVAFADDLRGTRTPAVVERGRLPVT